MGPDPGPDVVPDVNQSRMQHQTRHQTQTGTRRRTGLRYRCTPRPETGPVPGHGLEVRDARFNGNSQTVKKTRTSKNWRRGIPNVNIDDPGTRMCGYRSKRDRERSTTGWWATKNKTNILMKDFLLSLWMSFFVSSSIRATAASVMLDAQLISPARGAFRL